MPDILNRLSVMFPMGVGWAPDSPELEHAIEMLFSGLPPTPRTWSLVETYMENASWMSQAIKREDLIEDYLTPIYNAKKEREDPAVTNKPQISPHKLAVMFLVFAIGANADYTLPPLNEEAEKYHCYARAALSLRSIFDSPMMETVLAVVLLSLHNTSTRDLHSRDNSWTLTGLGCKLAQSVSHAAPFISDG